MLSSILTNSISMHMFPIISQGLLFIYTFLPLFFLITPSAYPIGTTAIFVFSFAVYVALYPSVSPSSNVFICITSLFNLNVGFNSKSFSSVNPYIIMPSLQPFIYSGFLYFSIASLADICFIFIFVPSIKSSIFLYFFNCLLYNSSLDASYMCEYIPSMSTFASFNLQYTFSNSFSFFIPNLFIPVFSFICTLHFSFSTSSISSKYSMLFIVNVILFSIAFFIYSFGIIPKQRIGMSAFSFLIARASSNVATAK